MIVVDTTVLVYAVGHDHPLRPASRALLAALRDGRLLATTTPEVIQEFAHVRSRRRTRHDAASLAEDYARLLRPLLPVDEGDLRAGLSTFAGTQQLGAFDAVLAATSLRHQCSALVSADQNFAEVAALPFVGLGHPDLVEVLITR